MHQRRGPPYWKSGPWSEVTQRKKGEDDAHVYGHDDPEEQYSPDTLESMMQNYLAAFDASHWRQPHGKVMYKAYKDLHRDRKKVGMMVMEPHPHAEGHWKFNIIMHKDDPRADIHVMEKRLLQHCMLCVGGSEKRLIIQFNKEEHKCHGDHASGVNVVFRTYKLRTYEMGLSKWQDETNKGNDTYGLRHAWISFKSWLNDMHNEEMEQEMANMLCHLTGYMPPYTEAFGGRVPITSVPIQPAQCWPKQPLALIAPSKQPLPTSAPPQFPAKHIPTTMPSARLPTTVPPQCPAPPASSDDYAPTPMAMQCQ